LHSGVGLEKGREAKATELEGSSSQSLFSQRLQNTTAFTHGDATCFNLSIIPHSPRAAQLKGSSQEEL